MYFTADNQVLEESGAANNWTIAGNAGGLRAGTAKNDAFDGVKGDRLAGGAGDDSYNLWDAAAVVVEKTGEGVDTVRVRFWGGIALADHVENAFLISPGATWATGNGLANILVAGVVGATLDGGGGDDVLVGGAGADLFRVKAGNGSDAVVNFRAGWDTIKLEGHGISSFDQLRARATQSDADIVLNLENGEKLVLRGVQLASLGAADFDLPIVTAKAPALDQFFTKSGQGWNSKGWYIVNNGWGSAGLVEGADFTLSSAFSSKNIIDGATFEWSYPVVTDIKTNIRAYPAVIFGHSPLNTGGPNLSDTAKVFPVKVDDIKGLTATHDVTAAGHLSGFNVAYDIWLSGTPNGTGQTAVTNEVMVWIQKGTLKPFGDVVGTYSKDGHTATVHHTGTYTAVVFDKDMAAGTVDVGDILAKLKDMGIVSGEEYLRSVELGSEVTSGRGSLTINDLTLRVETRSADGGSIVKTVGGEGTVVETIPPEIKPTAAAAPAPAAPVTITKTDAGGRITGYDVVAESATSTTTQHFDAGWKFLGADKQSVQSSGATLAERFDANWAFTGASKTSIDAGGAKLVERFDAAWKFVSADIIKMEAAGLKTSHYNSGWALTGYEVVATGTDGVMRTSMFNGKHKLVGTELVGTERADTLVGGSGATWFDGGYGADVMRGGTGVDTFQFKTAPGAGQVDVISRFTANSDKIALDNAVFTGLGAEGTLSASAFVLGTKALDASDRIIFDQAKGALFYDADGTGSQAAVLIANVSANAPLSFGDFLVV